MRIPAEVRAQLNADFDGPARLIYEWVIGARQIGRAHV